MINYPTAWKISQSVPPEEHDPKCSTAQTGGAILCDCHILNDRIKEDERNDPEFRAGSDYWQNMVRHDFIVYDPDGWDRKNYDDSWTEPITFREFLERANHSTIMSQRDYAKGPFGWLEELDN